MSVVPNNLNVGLSQLTKEYKRTADLPTTNDITTEIKQDISVKEIRNNTLDNADKITSQQKVLNAKQLDKVAQQLQEFVGGLNRNIEFSVDKESGRDVIKVIDKASGDLLKQFPSEDVLTMVSKLSEMVGGIVDAKA